MNYRPVMCPSQGTQCPEIYIISYTKAAPAIPLLNYIFIVHPSESMSLDAYLNVNIYVCVCLNVHMLNKHVCAVMHVCCYACMSICIIYLCVLMRFL